jgi:hypothetical protein
VNVGGFAQVGNIDVRGLVEGVRADVRWVDFGKLGIKLTNNARSVEVVSPNSPEVGFEEVRISPALIKSRHGSFHKQTSPVFIASGQVCRG